MSEEIKHSFSLYYCRDCGWSITNEEVQKISDIREKISYCQGCGKKLIRLIDENLSDKEQKNKINIPDNQKSNVKQKVALNNQYSDETLEICKLQYEMIGSFRGVKRELEMQGIKINRKTIKKELEKKFKSEGVNFDRWEKQYKSFQKTQQYEDSEVRIWEHLYKEIGSFPEVAKFLKQKYKKAPDFTTIIGRIKKLFELEERDFNEWRNVYKKRNMGQFLPHYSIRDAKEWKKLFEKSGSYRSVETLTSVDHHTIKKYITEMAYREDWDFEQWEENYHLGRYKYKNSDVRLWIDLYEKLGSFFAVSNYLNREIGVSPDPKNIKKRIMEEFISTEDDFDEWIKCYKKIGIYDDEAVLEWKSLYEELGNCSAISDYLDERTGESPDPTTIRNRLFFLFDENGWNFKNWLNDYYNDNSERQYLIGKCIHWILEDIFISFTLDHNKKGFYEIMLNRLNGIFTSVDNILINSTFDSTSIDYTTSIRKKVLIGKCKKGYQGFNRKLFIIALNSDNTKEMLKNNNLPFKENVKILNNNEFSYFMGYYGYYLENFNNAIGIMKRAYNNDAELNRLRELAKYARNNLDNLSNKYPISQEDYEIETSWWQNF